MPAQPSADELQRQVYKLQQLLESEKIAKEEASMRAERAESEVRKTEQEMLEKTDKLSVMPPPKIIVRWKTPYMR
jgi:hypothetical protein